MIPGNYLRPAESASVVFFDEDTVSPLSIVKCWEPGYRGAGLIGSADIVLNTITSPKPKLVLEVKISIIHTATLKITGGAVAGIPSKNIFSELISKTP